MRSIQNFHRSFIPIPAVLSYRYRYSLDHALHFRSGDEEMGMQTQKGN